MGSVAEAVLEFDEAVQVPWRPPLAAAPRPAAYAAGAHVLAMPTTRRPRAARVARLTVPPPLPAPATAPRPAVAPRPDVPVRRAPVGSTAVGHTCARCAGDDLVAPSVRLTRRARRLLAVLVAALAVLVGVWLGSVVGGGEGELVLVSDSNVVVQQGDTLWSIARSVAGGQDVRIVVDEIQQLNGLDGSTLQPGQVLRLP
jgi:nucleoid-associated protein YgaU